MSIIKTYIDHCLYLAEQQKEYLMYISPNDWTLERDMQDPHDHKLSGMYYPTNIHLVQDGKRPTLKRKGSDNDYYWKSIESTVTDDEIRHIELELNITLPKSYKEYLKYKHYYEIFWDLDIKLHPKPIYSWSAILKAENYQTQEMILNKGYLSIGTYSNKGIIAIHLGYQETEELEVVLFDYQTGSIIPLADTFKDFLTMTLASHQPEFQELVV